ncbi:MAG: GatB/YqeY domain-containing protein [Dehalococcoidia bacterium]
MPIVETIRSEMTAATKSRDARRRDIMRLLLAALNNARIEAGHDLSDDEAVTTLQREAKQRRDSVEEYRKGDREDLARAEQEELDVIAVFLPEALSDDEVAALVREAIAEAGAEGPGDVGKVMRPLMERVAGRADGRRVNELVREQLAAG